MEQLGNLDHQSELLSDPANQIQTGYYDMGAGGKVNGIDTRESAVENWNGSRTNYYTRKFIDPNPALADNQSSAQVIPWPFIRYTEMALSYAEAAFELGEEAEALKWVNLIRFRAGMPAVSDKGDALRQRIRNERRIELVYEEHRYHDTRRWLIAPTTVGRGIKSININAKLKSGATPPKVYKYDKSSFNYTYTVVDNTQNETRARRLIKKCRSRGLSWFRRPRSNKRRICLYANPSRHHHDLRSRFQGPLR